MMFQNVRYGQEWFDRLQRIPVSYRRDKQRLSGGETELGFQVSFRASPIIVCHACHECHVINPLITNYFLHILKVVKVHHSLHLEKADISIVTVSPCQCQSMFTDHRIVNLLLTSHSSYLELNIFIYTISTHTHTQLINAYLRSTVKIS